MSSQITRGGITAWFGSLTVQLKSRLAGMLKTDMTVTGKKEYEPIQSLYEQAVSKQATKTIADSQHPLFSEFKPLPSGRRLCVPKCKSNRMKLLLVPASIKLLNLVHCNVQYIHKHFSLQFLLTSSCCQCRMSLLCFF